jgi:Tfp pilus assembly protein PilF
LCVLFAVLAFMVLSACSDAPERGVASEPTSKVQAPAEYVGSEACRDCHVREYQSWSGSHHALAMQVADPETVLGDFDEADFHYGDEATRFVRDGDGYAVETPNADGVMERFRVTHTFGAHPLQQYLLEVGGGRLQAFSIAWDTRAQGQRWFHLNRDARVTPGDVLHWTGAGYNWNTQCADCHSTALRKNYDAATDTFATSWAEMTVGCEACHGPASQHVGDTGSDWSAMAGAVDTCAPCHSRRAQIAEGIRPGATLEDYYQVSSIGPGLYHADGQILDEVYVYGSFMQSRMSEQGVVCGHCHDPHSASVRLPGNTLCSQCHSPGGHEDFPTLTLAEYDLLAHHFHEPGSEGAQCVSCHMPETTYMVVDPRRDHSFRIPRPDLSIDTDIPNACTGCHKDRTARWAGREIAARFGERRAERIADVLVRGLAGVFDAEAGLATIANDPQHTALVRASALEVLTGYELGYSRDALTRALRSPDARVRIAAVAGIPRLAEPRRWAELKRACQDAVLGVRLQAATLAAHYLGENTLSPADAALVEAVVAEYFTAQELNADRPEAHTNVAMILGARGDAMGEQAALERALAIEPRWIPALVNLADLYRRTNRDAQAGVLLERAVSVDPPSAEAAYAYGLWLVRQDRPEQALRYLALAHELSEGARDYAYVYAVALHSSGATDRALIVLDTAIASAGPHRILLEGQMSLRRDSGDLEAALSSANRLKQLFGSRYTALVRELSELQH